MSSGTGIPLETPPPPPHTPSRPPPTLSFQKSRTGQRHASKTNNKVGEPGSTNQQSPPSPPKRTGRGRAQGGERVMGTATYGGRGFKERTRVVARGYSAGAMPTPPPPPSDTMGPRMCNTR